MPHPEAYHHFTQHPNWTLQKEMRQREGKPLDTEEGEGLTIFKNAFEYLRDTF
jgi:phosphoribosylformylglycinamidine synthase